MSQDIKYFILSKADKKEIERKEKIIIFGNKVRLNLMKKGSIIEYFIDITFKIISKCYRPYKVMKIATLDNEHNKTILIGFVLFIYMDNILYLKIYKYLNEIYKFNLIIVYTNYERVIELALKIYTFLKNSIINLKCFFHFSKAMREKLKKYTNNKKF